MVKCSLKHFELILDYLPAQLRHNLIIFYLFVTSNLKLKMSFHFLNPKSILFFFTFLFEQL